MGIGAPSAIQPTSQASNVTLRVPGSPANDLRSNGNPRELGPQMKPWPVSSDPPTAVGVRTTSYSDGAADRRSVAQPSTIVPVRPDSQPLTRPLPPIQEIQSLPPVMTTQPLPPIGGLSDRFPPSR
ncbi:MAG TPA: hypothetical protein VKB78_13310, partial [Pirellulales bacterium]|nr:hypothetical protein [Pirellulales bacterium]